MMLTPAATYFMAHDHSQAVSIRNHRQYPGIHRNLASGQCKSIGLV
jgi:hypothetical protein